MQNCQIIIILGAPCSGTNMLRDVLCRLPRFATWPCDEINALWRTGNARYPNDSIPSDRLRRRLRRRIRAAFHRQATVRRCEVLVEKTCANCLRLDYVAKCFPEALFVQIVRHPTDAIESTLRRLRAPLDPRYLAKKARYVPLWDLPLIVARSLIRHLVPHRHGWGPVLPSRLLPQGDVSPAMYAALQWLECVRGVDSLFEGLPPSRACRVRYEDFVADAEAGLNAIVSTLNLDADPDRISAAVAPVYERAGSDRGILDAAARSLLKDRGTSTLQRHGYFLDAEH